MISRWWRGWLDPHDLDSWGMLAYGLAFVWFLVAMVIRVLQ